MSKKLKFLAMMLACILISTNHVFGTNWSHTFSSNPISDGSMTISSATWSVSTSSATGSPTITYATYSKIGGVKFGSSSKHYWGKITLSTSYFTSGNISSVTVNALLNAGVSTTMTIKQGSTTIGSPNYSTATKWHDFVANTNTGSGGTLSIEITSKNAIYIHSISVTYTSGSTYTLVYNANGGSGSMSNTTGASVNAATCTFTPPTCKVFDHWNTAANNSGTSYNEGASVPSSTTLYAIWRNNPSDPSITFSNGNYTTGGSALNLSTLFSSNSSGAVTYSVTNAGGTGASIVGSSFSATTAGSCTVQASQAADAPCYNAKAVTATITVSAPTPATITLVNYDGDATTTGYYSGESFTLPNTNNATCNGKTFVGWSTVAIPTPGSKPNSNYYEKGASVTLGASNTFYAVFAESSGSGTTSSSITSYEDGTYYMIDSHTYNNVTTYYSPTGTASGTISSVELTSVVSVSNGVLTLDLTSNLLDNAMKYTISTVSGTPNNYTIYNASTEAYIGANTSTSFTNIVTNKWELITSNKRFMFWYDASTDRAVLYQHSYNSSGTQTYGKRFGCYAKSNAGKTDLQSNKEQYGSGYFFLVPATAAATYTNYTTSCACTAPDHVSISGTWGYFGGETISLTATAYSTNDDSSPIAAGGITGHQWQKLVSSTWTNVTNGTSAGVTTSGATTSNLQISGCKVDNSGKYRCVVSTGTNCSTASATATDGTEGFVVRVYALECYTGVTNVYNFTRTGSSQAGTVQVTLNANTEYEFKIHGDEYFGNNGTINEDVTNWDFETGKNNVKVESGLGGTFTFAIDYSANGSVPDVSVTYPRKTIYLTPNSDWLSGEAKFAYYYYRKEGETTYGNGWTDFIAANPCGMSAEIPQWNGVKVIAVRLKNTTVSPGSWDDKWDQTDDLLVSSYNSIVITGWSNSQTYNSNYSTPTYAISYDAGTNGTGSRDPESKSCGVNFTLPSTQVFTRNGYTMDGWSINANGSTKDYNLGGSYTTDAAQTFYPHWALASYDVTLNTNGGTINAGNVTSYTYGTGATLPTDVTKSHATFQGWYAASNFSGERVYSIGAAEYGNKEYWAKWETVTWTVTWKANGETVRTDASVTDGDKVASVPSAPSNLTTGSNGCDAEFVGWVIEANDPGALSISTRDTAPSGMFTNVAGSPAITANTTFVAIYRQEQ